MEEKRTQRLFITTEDGVAEEFPIPDRSLPVFDTITEEDEQVDGDNFHISGEELEMTFPCSFGFKKRILKKLGIYITNNDLKMHGQPMERKIAGRKGVRKKEY